MEGDAILSVQIEELREAAKLRWDGASELIRVEHPERATMRQTDYNNGVQIITTVSNHTISK